MIENNLALEDAFTLLEETPEELWEHEDAMAIRSKVITVFKEEIDNLSAQLKKRKADSEAVAALAVRMSKLTKVLVVIIEELCPRVRGMREPTGEEHGEQLLQQAGTALCKALGKVEDFFKQGVTQKDHPHLSPSTFYTVLPLRTDVNGLSAAVMDVLLLSDALQL